MQTGYQVCDFAEWDYGPRSYWPEEDETKRKKGKYEPGPPIKCDCGVLATFGLVPSELGVGFYCGRMVGDDLVSSFALVHINFR